MTTRAANVAENAASAPGAGRVLSVDFFRGLTMFLLIGESTLLYEHLRDERLAGAVLTSLAAWAMLWSLCWWLYKNKVLIKI